MEPQRLRYDDASHAVQYDGTGKQQTLLIWTFSVTFLPIWFAQGLASEAAGIGASPEE